MQSKYKNMYRYVTVILSCVVCLRVLLKLTIGKYLSDVKMNEKVAIVTGANKGIGYCTAMGLAARGARVILACRNEDKGKLAQNEIIKQTGNNNVVFKYLDLSSLKTVREFAHDILHSEERLDVLINNAGIFGSSDVITEDGIIEVMQVNHFAPFLLTLILLPILKKSQPSRIVNVNSIAHYLGFFNTSKLNIKGFYGNIRTYCNSKLCSLIFTLELAKRLQGTGVVANALHPGIVETNLFSSANVFTRLAFKIWCWLCSRTAQEGAQTVLYLAVSEETRIVTGKYFVDCKPRFMLWRVANEVLAQKIWRLSEKVVDKHEEKI